MASREDVLEAFEEAEQQGRRFRTPKYALGSDVATDLRVVGSMRMPWGDDFHAWARVEVERLKKLFARRIAKRQEAERRDVSRVLLTPEERRTGNAARCRRYYQRVEAELRAKRKPVPPVVPLPYGVRVEECAFCGACIEWREGCRVPVVPSMGRMMVFCCDRLRDYIRAA